MTFDEKRRYLRDYPWSSYGGYIFQRRRRGFLQVEEVLAYFGGDSAKGRRSYEEFVMGGVTGKITNPLEKGKGHGIVGANEFIEKIRGLYIRSVVESRELPAIKKILAQVEPEKIIRVICDLLKVERDELLRKGYKGIGRGVLMEMLYRHGGMKQREIGELMGIDYSAVSVMRKRFSVLQAKDQRLSALVERMGKRLQSSQE
jgi:DNA-binding MarR family transcriptional regulator